MSNGRKNWWGRNWKWFVPTVCVAGAICIAGFFAATYFGVMGFLKSSDAYKIAVATAKADSRVIAALGSPVIEGRIVDGNISLNHNLPGTTSGNARLVIVIHGPKGMGKIHAVGSVTAGVWTFSTLEVEVEGQTGAIDLHKKGRKIDQKERLQFAN